jgi:hypothetical protein
VWADVPAFRHVGLPFLGRRTSAVYRPA